MKTGEERSCEGFGLLDVDARYLIVGPTRSGTTALHLLLGGHPEISMFVGELSFPRLAAGIGGLTMRGYTSEDEDRLGRAALFDAVTGAVRDSRTRVLGAKTTVNSQAAARQFVETVRDYLPGLKIIVMVRRDMVAHYYSRMQLKKTGVAHSWQKDDASRTRVPARIDKWLLANNAIATLDMYRALRSVADHNDYIEIEYESFAQDNERSYRELIDFLGLDYVKPEWHQAKKLHADPEASIRNYQALSSYVAALSDRYTSGRMSRNTVRAIKGYVKVRRMLPGMK